MFVDVISLIACVLSLDTIRLVVKHRKTFWGDRSGNKSSMQEWQLRNFLAQRVAVFILIPLGVLLHELGHSIATWQFGGVVQEFQWRIFWGYIIPQGNFTPVELWWIAFSGNLVSILLGLLAIPIVPLMRKPALREMLYCFAVSQCLYALVYYPLLSLAGMSGDWVLIYNLKIFPYAQITIASQIALLAGLWGLRKSQWLERFRTPPPPVPPSPDVLEVNSSPSEQPNPPDPDSQTFDASLPNQTDR